MPLLRERCVCLRKVEFSETSQILTLFSREHGLLRLIAKGAHRRTKAGASKFDGGIDLLDVGEAVFSHAPARELPPLTEWSLQDGHLLLRRSLRAIYLASFAAELIVLLIEEHDPHPLLFDHLLAFIDAVGGHSREQAFLKFQMLLLREAGYVPRISGCGSCGKPTEERGPTLFMSPALGGRVCMDCSASTPDRISVEARLLRLLNDLPQKDPPADLSPEQTAPLNRILAEHVEHALSVRLRMTPFILPRNT